MLDIEIMFITFCILSEEKGMDIFMKKDAKFETLIKEKIISLKRDGILQLLKIFVRDLH